MAEKRVLLKDIVKGQLPQYVREEYPLVGEFLSQYYLSQEFDGAPTDLIQNIDKYVKIDSITNLKESTILGADISAIDNNISVDLLNSETGTDGFPEKYGLISIDDELIVYESKTFNGFTNCYRGFSGIVSYKNNNVGIASTYKINPNDQLIFKTSESSEHSLGTVIYNLSNLFLKEFLLKAKYQLSPGFEDRTFDADVNEATLLKQIKDFYRSKGTDQSFEILFKALYGENVEIVRPKDYLFRPSDAQYKITNDLVVDLIEGPIQDIPNLTLFQEPYLNITKAYGTVSEVETIVSREENKTYYKLKIDGGYNRDPAFDGAIYGRFSIHPKTKTIGVFQSGSNVLDVDSTVGFPNSGEFSVTYEDGTTGIVSYSSKNITQFLDCTNVVSTILDNTSVGINTYASATTASGEEIKVKINSILSGLDIDDNNYFYDKDDTAQIKTLGFLSKESKYNDWIFNVSPIYDVKNVEIVDASDLTYTLTLENNHIFRIGDRIEVSNNIGDKVNSVVIDVLSEKSITVNGQGLLSSNLLYKVKRTILKADSVNFESANGLAANVQNVYVDDGKLLVASSSLPSYNNQSLDVGKRSVTFSGSFIGDTFEITSIVDHGFYTGDSVYYTPEKVNVTSLDADGNSSTSEVVSSQLFDEGIYFIKRIDKNTVKFSRSAPDILNEKYLTLENLTEVSNSLIEPYSFKGENLNSQKLLREIALPVTATNFVETPVGKTGILANGVEILNYKGKDRIIYGPIEEVEVLSEGFGYDVINPPNLLIEDSVGTGATGYCSVFGSLTEIKIINPGFDYLDTPTIRITGGNGIGAEAKANMKLIEHEISFNTEEKSDLVGIGSAISTIGFSTSHKFRNGEQLIYKTFDQKAISGLSTNSSYFASVISPTVIKLHNTFGDAISGINTITLSDYGTGNHSLECVNKKLVVSSINVSNSGFAYENKKRTVSFAGINTSIDSINIRNHGFLSGEVVTYTTEGSVIGGLSNNTDYYVTIIDNDSFRLSQVGSGNFDPDFYYKTSQYVDITSKNNDIHIFNYPEIKVELIGNVGVSSEYKAEIKPIFRGSINSVHLVSGGFSYGVEDIFNLEREPVISVSSGFGAEFQTIVVNGKIKEVLVNNSGNNYTGTPDLLVSGDGFGAVLTPIVSNGQITEIKVIDGGSGYSQNTTEVVAITTGQSARFRAKIKNWRVNLFEKYINTITADDGFLTIGTNPEFGIQYTHMYAPRKLREILFSKDQSGKILYSNPDLKIVNNSEGSSRDHSPIIGWSYDGYPIYGPYGYSSRSGGSVTQMKSGYRLNLLDGRPSLNYFPEGFFVEDYSYFDSSDDTVLDEKNGRFCITPDFPNGTYAYFATINPTDVESDGPFARYKKPVFPYLIGNYYQGVPNQFNFLRSSNQDQIDLNSTSWIRNTYPYSLTENNSTYEYISLQDRLTQTIDITGVSPGSIQRIGILTGGDNYKVNDPLVFNNTTADGKIRGKVASAVVSELEGRYVSNISVASTTLYNVEVYPSDSKGNYVLYNEVPHGLKNFDLISILGLSTTSSLIEGNYVSGINTSKLSLVGFGTTSIGISSATTTGIVTYISVGGDLSFEKIRENDVYKLNDEKVKVLNVDTKSSRLRILREIDGTVGTSHSVTSILYEDSRKLVINSGFKTDYIYSINKEIYFDPSESVAISTDTSIGAGVTITFSNPGSGSTQVFVPSGSIYLPDHKLNTGDLLTYRTNGGTPIIGYTVGIGTTVVNDGDSLYVAKLNNDFIGISTVKVGLGSTGFFSGISTLTSDSTTLFFTEVGTGNYHSFKTNYNVISGQVSRNIVTVSTSQTHGLSNNDVVEIDVNPNITTTFNIAYNDYNRLLVANSKTFLGRFLDSTILMENHGYKTGDKVICSQSFGSTEPFVDKIYYIFVVDKDTVKITESYYEVTKTKPNFVTITADIPGVFSLVNPPLEVYRNSIIEFDLSDSSLSYTYQSTRYPAFKFELYTDSNFNQVYNSNDPSNNFNVQRNGVIGVSSDAKVTLTINEFVPETLYYRLVPIFESSTPIEKQEISVDDTVISGSQVQVKQSLYNGTKRVTVPSSTTFTYFLPENPEASSYSSTTSNLKYYTKSLTSYGPIRNVKITNKGIDYYSLPGITTVTSSLGKGAILESNSNNIGVVKKTKILDIGFDFPSDYTLRPNVSLPKVVKIDSLSSFDSIGISSFGRGYLSPAKLLVFDGKTREIVPEVDLAYNLGDTTVTIKNNSYGISDTSPIILPIQNSNGVGIRTISYNESNKKVTVGLSTGFSTAESFPFKVNDKVLIENISIGIGSTAKGFNSENYDYQLFTLTEIDQNIGGIGSVTYSLDGYLNGSEYPGTFNAANSSGRIIPEKYFPIFSTVLKKNNYVKGEIVKSGDSLGTVENWDPITNYLKISSRDDFTVGNKIEGLTSKTQGIASSITEFNYYAKLDSTSKFENGWQTDAGFLNDELQKIQDSFYYQNFSYSIKSKISFDDWNEVVSSLNHTVGFRKFSDLQMETTNSDTPMVVGISTQNTNVDVVVDMIGYGDLNCFYDFDLVRENSLRINSRYFSNRIFFDNRILTDYFESFGNRVLSIDDVSGQFNSNPRVTRFSEVNRFDLTSVRAQKYLTYVRDRRFTAQRQGMLVTLLHDGSNGYLNQYGRLETYYDLGSFDFAISGSEGILEFYPIRYSINDYDITTLSYNIKDSMTGVGSTTIGSVNVNTTSVNVAAASTVTIVSIATTYTSSKLLVEISGGDGEYEFDEINLIHDGTNVELIEYGQLTTGQLSFLTSSSGYGTYYPYISGSYLKVDFISNAGIGTTTYINTINVSIADTSNTGIGTIDLKHARIESRTVDIPSSGSPSENVILDYNGEYSAAYCLVQVSDITNNRHQLSEVIIIDDDYYPDPYISEFANLETYAGLGTIGGSVTGIGQTTQLTFTPLPGIDAQVKVYANILRIQDDDRDSIDLNNGTIETNYGDYFGTERDVRRSFDLTHKQFPIFEKYFDGSSSDVVNILDNTIEIPGHFFVTGEEVTYTNAGAGTTQSIGIATTTISGIGSTDKLPSSLYIVKVNENRVKVAASATDALRSIPNVLDLTSVGVGNSHAFTAGNQNAKVIISLDNIIQSPIVATSQTTTLSRQTFTTDDVLFVSGITSFFGGDLIRVEDEIMKIDSVGVGSTNAIRVRRSWLGTSLAGYSTGALVTKVNGSYNIVNNVLNFVEAPYGNIPIGSTTNPPDERDWLGISTGSKFHGRSFMRSGITNGTNESYSKNYIFDDISNRFDGTNRLFTLKSSGSDISGISNDNGIILVNDVFQGAGNSLDYTLTESSGITSIRFTGTASSVSYDVNTANLPVGGIIISVGSSEGFGYQPLVAAGGTAIVSGLGTISSISIGNSGSGYRSGIQTVRVGVQTTDSEGFYIDYIGTASIVNGNIDSVTITNPGSGYDELNPPEVIFDSPLSYSDIPLVYSSSSSGLGTSATIDVVVGQGSSVIDFEIKNTGYGYGAGEILTIPTGGTTGIPTTSSYTEFQVTIQNVFSDKFTGWSIGELQTFDDISELFDGETTTFPLTIAGNIVSIKAAKGSNINVQDLLLVFVNDILQVPGEGYVFEGGSIITFTEAPKGTSLGIPGTNDKCKIIFYRGTGSVDVLERNILETVKVGDKLVLGYDSSIGQSPTLQEEDRTVTSILSTDQITTNPYFGPGNTEDESLSRIVTWCRQTEDKIIDEQEISKDRMLYEPSVTPSAYIISSVGIGSTIVYVDNLRPFFNPRNENNISLTFQNKVTLVSQDDKIGAAATAIVSVAGTISSIVIGDGGKGYVSAPIISIGSTLQSVGLGTTATATSSISSGIVTTISLSNSGTGYTSSNPPVVLIEPPTTVIETNDVSSYSGDSGVIVGFGTTSDGISNKFIFDFHIPFDSYLRQSYLVGTAVTLSSINVGDYFMVYETDVGSASTSIYSIGIDGSTVGIGTEFVDNIYQVESVSDVVYEVVGIGTTTLRRVNARVDLTPEDSVGFTSVRFDSTIITFDSTVYTFDDTAGVLTVGLGFTFGGRYFGNFSWGKINLVSRSEDNEFNSYTSNGVTGITTSSIVKRTSPLKYINYTV